MGSNPVRLMFWYFTVCFAAMSPSFSLESPPPLLSSSVVVVFFLFLETIAFVFADENSPLLVGHSALPPFPFRDSYRPAGPENPYTVATPLPLHSDYLVTIWKYHCVTGPRGRLLGVTLRIAVVTMHPSSSVLSSWTLWQQERKSSDIQYPHTLQALTVSYDALICA